jgi:hypothetical protein
MRIKYLKFKNFVRRHKTSIAVAGTAGTCLYLNRVALRQHDEFLKEKGLYEEFYYPED